MNTGGRDDVPGVTRQRARFESLDVVGKVIDYHIYNVVREGVGEFGYRRL